MAGLGLLANADLWNNVLKVFVIFRAGATTLRTANEPERTHKVTKRHRDKCSKDQMQQATKSSPQCLNGKSYLMLNMSVKARANPGL